MNIETYKAQNNLSTNDIIELLKSDFPFFKKQQVTMCKNPAYGVTLAPKAVQILNKAHPPKKEKRARGNRVTIWMNDFLYALLLEKCESEGRTRQDVAETAIYTALKPEASTAQPVGLNSKLLKELNSTKAELKTCINELCLKCGEYRTAHLGSCDGCRWKH